MNLDYPQDPNLWEKNKANKIKELTSREKYQKFYFFFVSGILKEQNPGVISFHGGSVNYWAELDLNQRRHIANEFTVRPH